MTMAVTTSDIDRLRSIIAKQLGIVLDDSNLDDVADMLKERVRVTRSSSVRDYLERLASGHLAGEEAGELANKITVRETYFFRHPDHFRAFAEVALPDRLSSRAGGPVRILSAGCASGEEAYSLAIIAGDVIGRPSPEKVHVTGIDVSPSALHKAVQGRYSDWSLRSTSNDQRKRYFQFYGGQFVLDKAIRSMVKFENRNLLDNDPGFWSANSFDIVFFRNVAIYFSADTFRNVIDRLAGSMEPGGFLFLGPAETLRGVSSEFHLLHTHDTFYYRRSSPKEQSQIPASPAAALKKQVEGAVPLHGAGSLNDTGGGSWVDNIKRSSGRISSLAKGHSPSTGAPTTPPVSGNAALESVHEMLRRERFDEALLLLGEVTPASARDVDAMLLRAAVSTNKGQISEAESLCRRILSIDEFCAGAHYLSALCRAHANDRHGAAAHDETAAYLDPEFAMPRFHLGMMAKRAGDIDAAKNAFEQALSLLEKEDSARILLFGGGFSREALMQLCRAELRSMEAADG